MNYFFFITFTAVALSSGDWIEKTFTPQPHFQSLPLCVQKVSNEDPGGISSPWISENVSLRGIRK